MSKAISLKLQEDVFEEVEEITHQIKVPRNAYINKALEFYNQFNRRRLLRKKLKKESLLVRDNSLQVLNEFDLLQDRIEGDD